MSAVFTHDEGEGVERDLSFFREETDNEHWFPSYDKVNLALSEADIDRALALLTAAETVAGAFGGSVTEIETNDPIAYLLGVETGNDDAGFQIGYHAFRIRVSRTGDHRRGEVWWAVVCEYDDSTLATEHLTRDQLLEMKEGKVPQF